MQGENLQLQRDFEIVTQTLEVQRELISLLKKEISELKGETTTKQGNYRIFNRGDRETILQIIRN